MQRLYRIAAAHGHVKANINLQNGLTDGDFAGGFREVLTLNDKLMDLSPAPGYYNLAYYTSRGYGNIKRDRELALRYFRKAADLGNPEAQFYVAELLIPLRKAPDIARQMYRCAAEQGHANAAKTLGIDLKTDKKYAEGINALQLGVKFGSYVSAGFLEKGFKTLPPDDGMYYMALKLDPERSRRYQQIGEFLYDYSYLQPTVEEVDQIVPLPPAPLPPWDGGFQWLKAWRGPGPAQPSEDLIQQLAEAKQLDPATGLFDPKRKAAAEAEAKAARERAELTPPFPNALPIGALRRSGDVPNVDAHWRPRPPKGCVPWGSTHPTRYCTAGQPLPLLDVAFPLPWWQQWLSKEWKVYRPTEVEWELVRYQLPPEA
ncbi:sel1 repeat family protein [Pseudomonas sp. MWU13-2860]|nr:sel1 repeat family protein [Pseudomonas sp. MWU13-2860]